MGRVELHQKRVVAIRKSLILQGNLIMQNSNFLCTLFAKTGAVLQLHLKPGTIR